MDRGALKEDTNGEVNKKPFPYQGEGIKLFKSPARAKN